MQSITIRRLRYRSIIWVSALTTGSFGLFLGFILLCFTFSGWKLRLYYGQFEVMGLSAGLLSLIILPVLAVCFGVIIATILYLPLVLLSEYTNLIHIKGIFELKE